jgi:hypothetical protein
MKKTTLILSAWLLSLPALADKPSWAGGGEKPQQERLEQHRGDEPGDPRRRPEERKEKNSRSDDDGIEGFLPLSERERRWLRDQVLQERYGVELESGKMKSLPPGLEKKLDRGGELPPGWRDKVRRGEVLDADLYRRGERLPRRYLERLGYDPETAELILLGDSVVRVARGRGTVLDVIDLTDKALEMLGR